MSLPTHSSRLWGSLTIGWYYLAYPGFAQAWKVLEYSVLSWNIFENKICLEKYLKNSQRPWKVFEFYHLQEDLTLFFGGLNQYKIVVPLFGAAYAAPNKGNIILHWFYKTNIFSNGL